MASITRSTESSGTSTSEKRSKMRMAPISVLVTPALRRRTEERFARGAANQALLVESVTGIETLKSMAVEPG